jgi:two-component system response regulator MprA
MASRSDALVPDPPTLLIVEDDPALLLLVAGMLGAEGYRVREAADGVEAVEALEQLHATPQALGCMLLDLMLPGVDGLDVLRRFKELEFAAPVLAMSSNRELLEAARSGGAQASLVKPFDLDQLLAAVQACCPRPG